MSVKNPKHYTMGGIEPRDFIMSNNLSFFEGNIIKYISRWRYKNGIEDLEKAKEYLEKLIEYNKKILKIKNK